MKKVIVINPVNFGRDSFRVPFGLLTIASLFDFHGVEIKWIDADAMRNDPQRIEDEVLGNLDADLIAIGGLHSSYRFLKEFCQFLDSKNITTPLLVGGKLAQTLDHMIWEKIPRVDMLCKQEGENVVESVCKHFPEIDMIKGIVYKRDGKIISNEPASIIESLDSLPSLRWDLLERNVYFSKGTGYILSSRGCPYSCKFCRYSDEISRHYRSLSAIRVAKEMEFLINNYDIKTIVFVDEFFMLNKKRVRDFCDILEKRNLKINWVISSRANAVKPKDLALLKRMKTLGCRSINMGIESGSQTMLNLMNKDLKIEQIEVAIKVIKKSGINLKPTFIFAFPGETRETALESVRWRLKEETNGLYTVNKKGKYFYATPYPGAPLYDHFIKKYRIDLDGQEKWILQSASLKEQNFNLTDMSDEGLEKLDNECKDILKNRGRFFRKIKHKFF